MVRQIIPIIILAALAGCGQTQPQTAEQPRQYADSPASALAMTPPYLLDQPPVTFYRDEREVGAFAGYEDITSTYFYLRQEDRQDNFSGDRIQRRAVTRRVGVSFR